MPVLLFYSSTGSINQWCDAISAGYPDLEIRIWPDWGNPDEADFALVWQPPAGELKKYKNLKAIFSLGAGVDYLLKDPALPENIPIVRLVDKALTSGMSEYVVMQVLYHHRRMFDYAHQQTRAEWRAHPQIPPWRRSVGIMGVGVLGTDVIKKLLPFEFKLLGWSRTKKEIPGLRSYAGTEQLETFLQQCEILVCLLPLTKETEGILDNQTLSQLPPGASVINTGRGQLLNEQDLLKLLDKGHISAATLDVFQTEPLPGDHPFWSHPRVLVTPHIASLTSPETYTAVLVDNMKKLMRGETVEHGVDRGLGY